VSEIDGPTIKNSISFQVIREVFLLLINRIKNNQKDATKQPERGQSEFHGLCCALVDATANGPRPDSPLWDELSALFKRILGRTCADGQQQIYSNFLIELDAVRLKAVHPQSLSPDAFGAWLQSHGEITELERQRRELENRKIALKADISQLSAHLERQAEKLAEDTKAADEVVARANSIADDLIGLIESLNDELKLPD
jgi:outer membrane murein-binding lipoprotein Lpp